MQIGNIVSNRLNGRLKKLSEFFEEDSRALSFLIRKAQDANPIMMKGKKSTSTKRNILRSDFVEEIEGMTRKKKSLRLEDLEQLFKKKQGVASNATKKVSGQAA